MQGYEDMQDYDDVNRLWKPKWMYLNDLEEVLEVSHHDARPKFAVVQKRPCLVRLPTR